MKKLLIVVDFQNDFVDGSLGFEKAVEIAPVIKSKLDKYLNNNDDVIFTLDTHQDNYMETMEGHKLPIVHCIKNTKGWELYPLIKDYQKKAIKVFEKPTFPSLDLANYLKDKDYQEVEVCGLVSNICVISNAIMVKAALPNAKIFVDSKATASSFDKLHEETFDVLEGLHIDVIR